MSQMKIKKDPVPQADISLAPDPFFVQSKYEQPIFL